ncbi:MAG: glycosyltransferase [Pseudomonadota bacterium]|nr:glycosyltransferase [Pseudomonadota bacterium]
MNVLFVHNNFPAQFKHVAARLHRRGSAKMAAIGSETATEVDGVELRRYRSPGALPAAHTFSRRFEAECRRAEQVMFAALALKQDGFDPDLIVAHCGWGETLPLRSVFPRARLAVYCEFYYRPEGQDVGFDLETGQFGLDGLVGLNAKNASSLIALAECDLGLSPTPWQRSTFPREFHAKIHVAHEGVDTTWIAPDPAAKFQLPGGPRFDRSDEVVTYFARGLEPMRGFHIFMRAVPEILRLRPQAQIVIVGAEEVSYGNWAPDGGDWKQYCLREILPHIDLARVHFLERLPHAGLRALMQVSRVHVYLTYPFVLSWSCIEALAAGCAIVASDTAPVRDVIVDGENGVLTPFHDPSALANAVGALLADPARRARLSARARETAAAAFNVEACVSRTLDILGLAQDNAGHLPAAVGA